MSEGKKGNDGGKKQQAPPPNIVQIPSRCPVEACGKKPHRAGFCTEHFLWFKEGLINRKGDKPKDFDKKYQAFQRRTTQKAA